MSDFFNTGEFLYRDDFYTGEFFQQKADVYIGFAEDFEYNPLIRCQTGKFIDLSLFCGGDDDGWQNPRILFCYGHRLRAFIDKVLCRIQNSFILISHNSDENICGDWPESILKHPLLEMWYAQNACLSLKKYEKLRLLPIGLANSQWPHGNLQIFRVRKHMQQQKKPGSIYFQFKLETNFEKRSKCMSTLWSRLDWLCETAFETHLQRLAAHEFCICPEGNGVDTHRFWECIYLRVVPIVVHSPFIANLMSLNCPMIVLEKWEDLFVVLDSKVLNYSHYVDKFSDFRFVWMDI